MPEDGSQKYLKPYREAVARRGESFKATLWSNEDAQQLRFDVMIDMASFDDCTIIDLGCGRGDFAARLIERGVRFRRFIGVDALPEQIELARSRAFPACEFRTGDVLADSHLFAEFSADYATISGTLNTMDEETARTLVQRAFDHAAQGVIFNFLSDRPHARWRERNLAPARRFNTLAWLDWAMSLTSRVAFTQEYLDGHDATILMRHEGD